MISEIRAIYKNDPAARALEPLLYPGLHAILGHKFISHPLYRIRLRFLSRFFSQLFRFFTGIEIHPGARLGKGVFIDHGMGIVIGETAELGDHCVLFHGVTLGGTGKEKGKRHPTVEANVLIGANATILGPGIVGEGSKIGAETVLVNKTIPPNCTVVGAPGLIVRRAGRKVKEHPQSCR